MCLLSWNCRGLGQARKVQELVCIVQTHRLKLKGTRQESNYVQKLKWRLGMKHCFTVNGEGKGGGLALFWEEDVQPSGKENTSQDREGLSGR
ncbi:hypothetical protein BRADI_3g31534v3 [Brachypodium distachyon]|uniref:Endonuclease/exonuclease/phosphatase domain-containing protein n=1 Tax=Brachypodium distachyon TaxID=15368 RepID=A0A2K2D0E5_BRADI|nr:hypothetical protein BRADI_3g31534v3 [Brachypodium distachyon]